MGLEMAKSKTGGRDIGLEEQREDYEKLLSDVLVAIPAYNEEIAIGSVVVRTRTLTGNVLVVDDGSADSTAEVAARAGATVVDHGENRGKGAAIRSIFEYASAENVDAVVLIDGDGQHDTRDIPDVVQPVLAGECDVAIGSRYVDGKTTETPIYRRIGQRTLDLLTPGTGKSSLTDTQSGFRALSPAAIERLSIETDGIGVESEMISSASDQGLSVVEVPIDVRYEDIDGQTYNPINHGLSVAVFALQLVRDRHPLVFFGLPGVLLLGFGGALGLEVVLTYQGPTHVSPLLAALTGFVVIIGLLCLFSGLVLNQIGNMIREVR